MLSRTAVLATLLVPLALQAAEPVEAEASGADEAGRAKRQAERVMNAGLPVAERMLAERGEFAPFGAVLLPEGLIRLVRPGPGSDGEATAESIYEELLTGLRAGATSDEYRAVATFALVELRSPADGRVFSAVHVALEQHDGYCVDVYYPTVSRDDSIVLGDSFADERAGSILDACAKTSPID